MTRAINALCGRPPVGPAAAGGVVAQVYDELRRCAQRQVRGSERTLGATALIHEVYLRLVGTGGGPWEDRRHFFNAAAEAMRHIIIDAERRRRSLKRGGAVRRIPLTDLPIEREAAEPVDWLAIDAALHGLELRDPDAARVVALRVFTGLSVAQTAEVMALSESTVHRVWRFARAWLFRELGAGTGGEGSGGLRRVVD